MIICQGPRNRFQLISWDTRSDKLQYGHLVRALTSAADCDLSPDGELFAYWARRSYAPQAKIWLAISRPPFLTAIALWFLEEPPAQEPTFLSDRVIRGLPRGAPDQGALPKSIRRDFDARRGTRGEDRHLLDGWCKGGGRTVETIEGDSLEILWYREQPRGDWVLCAAMPRKKPSSRRSYVMRRGERVVHPLVTGFPSDWDQSGRLILTQGDQIFAAPAANPLGQPKLILDLRSAPAEMFPSPDWATKWPRA
ncbi:MAG: hypothetical protein SF069_06880 [Phycisphaerae bacterium]|nr:hypothetical protein [Phycisphaerae bacterium]